MKHPETEKPTPASRDERKEATAREVLAAARDEFERAGFEGASVRAIAGAAGVAAGTVLHHFGDKRGLLHAALWDDLEATLSAALGRRRGGRLEARLLGVARDVFGYYQRRPALSRELLAGSLLAGEPWAARFREQNARAHAAVERQVSAAAARGELDQGADARLFAVAWLAFFHFALIGWAQGALPDPVGLVGRLTTQHLDGLRSVRRAPAGRRRRA